MSAPLDIATLYAQLGPLLYARCRQLLKDDAAAEDATQDIFLKVIKHLDSAPQDTGLLPWMYRITLNHCLNVLRDRRRHAEPVAQVPEAVDDEFEETLLNRNLSSRVLAHMPETLRVPADLFHSRGMAQSKVAEALGVSRRTVLYRLAEFTRRAVRMKELAET